MVIEAGIVERGPLLTTASAVHIGLGEITCINLIDEPAIN